jgi:anti-anti-sigma regulatory factor
MPTNALWLKIEPERLSGTLQEALAKLDSSEPEVVLDFSAVRRIDAPALQALETLAGTADQRAIHVVLCGVNVDVYKVLKLMKLAPRFGFLK